jgi:hypothetical protein
LFKAGGGEYRDDFLCGLDDGEGATKMLSDFGARCKLLFVAKAEVAPMLICLAKLGVRPWLAAPSGWEAICGLLCGPDVSSTATSVMLERRLEDWRACLLEDVDSETIVGGEYGVGFKGDGDCVGRDLERTGFGRKTAVEV